MFAAGTIIGGKYAVERTLGAGGMGTVVAAAHLQLGHRVAIKFLHEDLATDPSIVERFVREARACVRLDSPHVCRVSDIDVLDDGRPYIIMEWLAGDDLSAVAKQGPLSLRKICDFVAQACDGLADAHALGIIHRDLKPSNLFVQKRDDGDEVIKVLDFGIARVPAASPDETTQTGVVLGSPSYMAPEQLRNTKVANPQTDIWSLGVILYELVAGRRPYVGDTFPEIILHIAEDPLPPLSRDVPPELAGLIARCLDKDPRRRFPDAVTLAAELRRIGPAIPLRLTQAITAQVPAEGPHSAAVSTTLGASAGAAVRDTPPPQSRRARRIAWISAGALATGVTLGFVAIDRRPEHRQAAPVAPPADAAVATATPPLTDAPAPPDAAPIVPVDAPAPIDAGPRPVRHVVPVVPHKHAGSAAPENIEDLRK